MREGGLQSYGTGLRMGAGYQSRWHPLQELLTSCPCLLLSVAVTQGLKCHLCKGFGGCSHQSHCPWRSTHCVTIATRECDGRDGMDTPFLYRELAHWAGRAQSPADQEHSRNVSGSLCLGQGPGRVFQCLSVALNAMAGGIEVLGAQSFRKQHRLSLIPQGLPSALKICLWWRRCATIAVLMSPAWA